MGAGDNAERDHLFAVLDEFDTAMLVTKEPNGELRGRPMAIAGRRGDTLYFATDQHSPKVDELGADPLVAVVCQSKRRFLSLSGRARVTRDRALVDEMWSEGWKVWFPNGKDDPELVLLEFDPDEGAYWDESGTKGLRYLFRAASAYVTGNAPGAGADEAGKVRF
jgi:general stress protein 26